jgi:phosphate transport system ATP-binding protein
MTSDAHPLDRLAADPAAASGPPEMQLAVYEHGSVVTLAPGSAIDDSSLVDEIGPATITVTDRAVSAEAGRRSWSWAFSELQRVVHGTAGSWTLLVTKGQQDLPSGVWIESGHVAEFRKLVDDLAGRASVGDGRELSSTSGVAVAVPQVAPSRERTAVTADGSSAQAELDARNISAWFGDRQVLDRVSLHMQAGEVTALIGPSGCGKSTFLRILNRMHEMIPSARMAGEVLVDGHDVYDGSRRLVDARREIGMVFQKPNPFPAMSIYDNVLASYRLTGRKATTAEKDAVVEECLARAGLWNEVKDRLRQPGGGLSGGQQQRLCIARALAIRPRVLLMDEPCSALDPTSTRRIEETILQLVADVTIVIVTHNMQQAARVSDQCAFFLAEHGTPGVIVEHGPTDVMFSRPQDPRTNDYVNGRFG